MVFAMAEITPQKSPYTPQTAPRQESSSQLRKNLRVIPHNLDAEQALLGAIMLKPESMHDISVSVYPESFYADKHREIFTAMLDIFTKSNPIDLLSVTHKLKDRQALDRIGGASYLTELIENVPAAGNAGYYAEVVQDKAVLRGLIRAADDIAEMSFSNPENVDETLDNAEKKIYQVTQSPTAQKFTPIKNSLGEAWDRLDRLHNAKGEIRGVQTGFPALDNLLAGLQKSDLIILAARPSVGKTAFALDIARHAACQYKTPVGIFSLEMSDQQLVDRMLAAEAKVDAWKLRTGKLSTDEEFALVQEAMGRLSEAPIHIDDQPGNSILKMRSAARRLKNEFGLGLIVVDYLQLMMPPSMRYHDSMVQQVTEISRALKIMARELDVPVLALSQLSRAVEQRGGKPRLSDLRDSGSIEQDADVVMFIHRDDKTNENSERPNIAQILVEKHRNGPTGSIELYFDEKRTTFLSLENKRGGEDAFAAVADDDF
jgi:replicative DNA helicase